MAHKGTLKHPNDSLPTSRVDGEYLPGGWAQTTLENVVDILDGRRVPVNAKERARRAGRIPYYGATGQVGWIDDFLFDETLVLLGEDGAPFFDKTRRVAYSITGKSWVNNHAHVLRALTGITPSLLSHQLNTVDYHPFVSGTTRWKLSQAPMRSIPVKIPPASEQLRIADTLDELLSDLDAGVAALERVRDKLKLYRASVLKAAVEGALTAEWRAQNPNVEPANELLERILAERRRRWEEDQLAKFKAKGQEPPKNWKAKYKEPNPPATTNDLEFPFGWTWATVDIVASGCAGAIQSGPFGSQLLHSEFVREGILAIGIDNVLEGHFSLGREHRITPAKFESLRKFEARPGDVVITVMATVGRVCVLPQTLETAIITKHCYRVTPIDRLIDSDFLALTLRADSSTRRHIFGNLRGQTRPGINGPILKAAPVPVPPIEEQQVIVELVDDQLSIIEHIEADLDAKLQNANSLRQAVLRHAFTGQLVPQDPNDEPAAELLKHIAAEREARRLRAAKTKSLQKTKAKSN